jgi:uncharacterized damage-inducible protein DinB
MNSEEVESYWRYIKGSVDRIVACLDGLDEKDLNWKPLENANSLYVLASHTMTNLEENLIGVLGGAQSFRAREEDFKVSGGSAQPLQQRWRELNENVSSRLGQLSDDAMCKEFTHPRRGKVKGRDVFIVVARHAAEHMGQAELTRDLLFKARGRPIPIRQF